MAVPVDSGEPNVTDVQHKCDLGALVCKASDLREICWTVKSTSSFFILKTGHRFSRGREKEAEKRELANISPFDERSVRSSDVISLAIPIWDQRHESREDEGRWLSLFQKKNALGRSEAWLNY